MSTLPARPAQRLNLQDKTPGTRDEPAHAHLPRGSLLPASCQLSINAVVVGIGLNLDGLGLGRRSHVDRLFSFLSLIGRYPALIFMSEAGATPQYPVDPYTTEPLATIQGAGDIAVDDFPWSQLQVLQMNLARE